MWLWLALAKAPGAGAPCCWGCLPCSSPVVPGPSDCLCSCRPPGLPLPPPPLALQVLQHIPGRGDAAAAGEGHCDSVLGCDAHPQQALLVSVGNAKDRCVKVWEHQA